MCPSERTTKAFKALYFVDFDSLACVVLTYVTDVAADSQEILLNCAVLTHKQNLIVNVTFFCRRGYLLEDISAKVISAEDIEA